MTEKPAETLRRAAGLIRERATKATPGPWEHPMDLDVTHGYRMKDGRHIATWLANCDAGDGDIPEETAEANADYIASMHPLVGLAVATWLDEEAERATGMDGYEDSDAYPLMLDGFRLPLAVARAYLGEEQA